MGYKAKDTKSFRNKAIATQRTVKDSYNEAIGLQDTLKRQYKDLGKARQTQEELNEMSLMLPVYAELFEKDDSDADSNVLDVNLMNLYFQGLV